jgi:hypothetical protein
MKHAFFTEATLLKDGTVKVIDDSGEEFHLCMVREEPWPVVFRKVRRFELLCEMEERPGTIWSPRIPSLKLVRKSRGDQEDDLVIEVQT